MRASILILGLAACGGPSTSTALQNVDTSDPAAIERIAIEPWLAHSDETPQIEDALDAALRAQYSAGLGAADDYRQVVRTAAIHWAREVRRQLGDSLHTRVEALQDDPDCQGSVVRDAVLLDYVVAATSSEHRVDRAEAALATLARQTACLEQFQSTRLATAMKIAFSDVESELRIDHLEGAIPYLAQATASPMLIVQDVERQWGPDEALSRWFKEYEAALLDGVRSKHQPMQWHGLWLYDRMTGTVRGFRAAELAHDENEVALAALFQKVAHPEPADLKCSYSEIIQRGTADGVYHCLGAACANGDEQACAVPASGAGDTPPEKGAVDLPEFATSAALSCVVKAREQSSTRKTLTCLMEATGARANPLEQAAKELTATSMTGLKPGGHCDLGVGLGTINMMAYQTQLDAIEKQYQQDLKDANFTLGYAIDKLAAAQAGKLPTEEMSADEKKWTDAINSPAEAAAKMKAEAEKKRDAAIKALQQAAGVSPGTGSGGSGTSPGGGSGTSPGGGSGGSGGGGSDGGGGSAGPGSAGSGAEHCVEGGCSGCSAMSALAQSMLACVADDQAPPERKPLNVDPIDPDVEVPNSECFTELAAPVEAELSRACWAVHCAASDTSVNACCGGASLSTGEPMHINGMCGSTDCADGVQPTYDHGQCTCGHGGTGLPNGPVLPSGPNVPNRFGDD